MIVKTYTDDEQWKIDRLGLITGTRRHGCRMKRGGTYGKTFWQILAERVCQAPDDENPMHRGNRLEPLAVQKLAEATGLTFGTQKTLWVSEETPGLAISPDAPCETDETIAGETKCLDSAHHLEAYFTKDYPKSSKLYYEYKAQARGYFHVNPKLNLLIVGFYDPRSPIDFHYIEILRSDIEKELEQDVEVMKATLEALAGYEKQLTF